LITTINQFHSRIWLTFSTIRDTAATALARVCGSSIRWTFDYFIGDHSGAIRHAKAVQRNYQERLAHKHR
jgi:hypothetical protein